MAMRCASCGIDLIQGAAFCPSCGKPISSLGGSGVGSAASSVLQPNVAGLLSYLMGFITGILFLVLEPYKRDRFVRFHAFQSIFLSAAWLAISIALEIALSVLPGVLWRLASLLLSLLSLAVFVLAVFLMYKAYTNVKFKLPVIGDLAEKQA